MNKRNIDLKTDFTAFAEVDNLCFEKCFTTFYSEMKGSQETCFGKTLPHAGWLAADFHRELY